MTGDDIPEASAPPLFLRSSPISKDVIVHSVYYDDRLRDGHETIFVFLVDVNRTIFDSEWIVGCGVGNTIAKNFSIRLTAESFLMHTWLEPKKGPKPFLFEEFIVECYDIKKVENGSRAFVMYKTSNHSRVFVADSVQPLMIPSPRVQPSGRHNFTVVTCTKVHDKGVTWLPEFVQYQKTIGVDHVHVNILDTFIKDGGLKTHLNNPFVAQAVLEGYVSFTVWTEWYDMQRLQTNIPAFRNLEKIRLHLPFPWYIRLCISS